MWKAALSTMGTCQSHGIAFVFGTKCSKKHVFLEQSGPSTGYDAGTQPRFCRRSLAICGKAIGLIVDGSSFINAPPEPRIAGRGVKKAALVRSRDTDLEADCDDIEFLKVQNGSGICVSGRVCLSAKVGAFGTCITIAIPKVLERAATAVVSLQSQGGCPSSACRQSLRAFRTPHAMPVGTRFSQGRNRSLLRRPDRPIPASRRSACHPARPGVPPTST